MKFLKKAKDGGPESTVTGYWLAEIKSLFSVVLLRFDDGSRDAYHEHAFGSLNWVLKGKVEEQRLDKDGYASLFWHTPGLLPIVTLRSTLHKVVSRGTTWVFSIRGPWAKTWREWDPKRDVITTLGHGRVVIDESSGNRPPSR